MPADRFDDGGPDAGKPWLLGADDTLTEIRDEHVAQMEQREFDELVEGLGPSRTLAGEDYDPHGAVERHAAWTAAIQAAMPTNDGLRRYRAKHAPPFHEPEGDRLAKGNAKFRLSAGWNGCQR
jgi:hypothetical protein